MLQSKWASEPTDDAMAPAYNDMDPFAQTASTDDLFFDDDMTPIDAPVVELEPEPQPESVELQGAAAEFVPEVLQPPPAPQAQPPPHAPREPKAAERGGRGRGRARDRARGRTGRGGGRSSYSDVRLEEQEPPQHELITKADPAPAAAAAAAAAAPVPPVSAPAENVATPTPTPTEPKDKTAHSVRGDRTLTGGAARTRLTEEQLNTKLANMRSKNVALQTAHARAEADQAHFEAREAVLKKKDVERNKVQAERQKAERQNRQQMMGEREKNRLRKLNAQGGREWDHEKEDGFSGTGDDKGRGATRGAHGGIASSRHSVETPSLPGHVEESGISQSQRGRGRGHGARGGRGGRGDHQAVGQPVQKKQGSQQAPSAADFPDLPPATVTASNKIETPKILDLPTRGKATSPKGETTDTKITVSERPHLKHQDSIALPSPLEKGRSWADEVSS